MPVSTVRWYVERLKKQIQEEKKAYEAAKAQASAKRR